MAHSMTLVYGRGGCQIIISDQVWHRRAYERALRGGTLSEQVEHLLNFLDSESLATTSPYSGCLEIASNPAIVRFYDCLRVKTKRTVEKIGADGVSDRGQGRKRSGGQSWRHSATAIVLPSSVVASECGREG